MPYREKKIYSGAMLEIERVHCHSCGRVIGRRGRGLPTGKAQEKINLRNAQLRLARLLCENFKRGDYHVALTFGKELERDEQQKILSRFLRRLRTAFRKATGRELRYVCVREDRGTRPHYHLVCEAFGANVDELAEMWDGGRLDVGTLDGNPDYGWMARYLTKQEGTDRNKKRWSQSRNLRQPYEPEPKVLKRKALAYPPRPPKGYYVLSHYHQATASGYEWEYMVCIRQDRRQELPFEIMQKLEDDGCWSWASPTEEVI